MPPQVRVVGRREEDETRRTRKSSRNDTEEQKQDAKDVKEATRREGYAIINPRDAYPHLFEGNEGKIQLSQVATVG